MLSRVTAKNVEDFFETQCIYKDSWVALSSEHISNVIIYYFDL